MVLLVACNSATRETTPTSPPIQEQNENQPQMEWFDSSITTQEDCREDKKQYWYNNKCWINFEDDAYHTQEEIDRFIEIFEQLHEETYIRIDKTFLKTLFPSDIFLTSDDNIQITQAFEWEGVPHSMIITLPMPIENGKFQYDKQLATSMTLAKGNWLAQEDVVVVSKGKGTAIFEFVDLEYKGHTTDVITISGTLDNEISYTSFFNTATKLLGVSILTIEGKRAILSGTLGINTYNQIRTLKQHPEVKILVLQDIPGSITGELNKHIGIMIHELELITFVPYNSYIASGGVELLAAGKERIVERGGEIGIHAWSKSDIVPADYPLDHPIHKSFIEYYSQVMGPDIGFNFYFRTIHAASADDMYYMTESEMLKSQIVTKIIERGAPLD